MITRTRIPVSVLLAFAVCAFTVAVFSVPPAGAASYMELFDDEDMPGIFTEDENGSLRPLRYPLIDWGSDPDKWCHGCMGLWSVPDNPFFRPRGTVHLGIIPDNVTEIHITAALGMGSNTQPAWAPHCRVYIRDAWVHPTTGAIHATAPDASFSPEVGGNQVQIGSNSWRSGTAGMYYDTRTIPVVPFKPKVLSFVSTSNTYQGPHFCGVESIIGLANDPSLADTSSYGGGDLVGGQEPVGFTGVGLPRVTCGRTLRQTHTGQWLADVEAHLRNPSASPLVDDSVGEWRVSWDPLAVFSGSRATIPLPHDADVGDTYWVAYRMTRTAEVPLSVAEIQQTSGSWTSVPEVKGGPVIMGPWAGELFVVGGGSGQQGYMIDTDGDGVGDKGGALEHLPSIITESSTVGAFCSLRTSPEKVVEDGERVVVDEFPAHPDDTGDDTSAPPAPGDESPEGACGGGSWWNPVTWAKSLFCGVLDLADLLKDLIGLIGDLISAVLGIVTGILNGIKDLFIPDSLDFLDGLQTEWSNKFPVSVLTQITTALGHVTDAVDEGMSSSCGPTLDPNLSGAGLELPGATPADLDDLKISLPTPNDACDQSDASRQLADLHGYRRPIRGFLEVFLVVGFLVRMAHSIGPGRTDATPNMDGSASR